MNSLVHGFESMKDGKIVLNVKKEGAEIFMDYSDNGRGMDGHHLEKLFDAFFTTKRGQGGSGLGTHIMYNLVTQTLSGQIEAQSEPGKGLQYHIRFPHRD